ncbi:hypothetical protein [Microcystis aeruginosa]|uniref:Acyl-CoA dehydrogenase/oxidase C-terminal domain-containing protein n=1 Tax=Microcystis aeruginosa NIES-2521 TaxID=2303983 RepID=A0A5A5RTA9_MICAE|nr:hypothetical protein [Microcystis aeruginosa]GCA78079.1 hypothetical protein MiTs_00057 [Microcystis aeruginosa NIES-2521]
MIAQNSLLQTAKSYRTLAAVTISKGAANSVRHPAQRIYREALVFAVSGQTEGIIQLSLKLLTSKVKSLII